MMILLLVALFSSLTPFLLVALTKGIAMTKKAQKIPPHEFEVWGYLYGGKKRFVSCVLFSLYKKGAIAFEGGKIRHRKDLEQLSPYETFFLKAIKENQPYKLYHIYFDPKFLEEMSNIHQQLKKEGLFFEFPRGVRILAVSLPSAPIIIHPLLLIFSNFSSGLIITLFMVQTGWFMVFAMTVSNDFLDYKATAGNLNKDAMRDPSGNPFSLEELQVIMHGIPDTDLDLKRLIDVHSKRRRIELKPQIYP